jgi:hypothetical protein
MTVTRLLLLSLLGLFLVHASYAQEVKPQKPPCRMVSIKLDSVTKDGKAGQETSCPETYAALCDNAVSELDAKCKANCGRFKKRAEEPAVGPTCGPNPVAGATDEYKPSDHCKAEEGPGGTKQFAVRCTVSATCTCDP